MTTTIYIMHNCEDVDGVYEGPSEGDFTYKAFLHWLKIPTEPSYSPEWLEWVAARNQVLDTYASEHTTDRWGGYLTWLEKECGFHKRNWSLL